MTEREKVRCDLCDHEQSFCLALESDEGFACTRPKNHDGPHAACGVREDEHPLEEWMDKCDYCHYEDGSPCGVTTHCLGREYHCTRPAGHDGLHAACGGNDKAQHPMIMWSVSG